MVHYENADEMPHFINFKDITDNANFFEELEDSRDISLYRVNSMYYVNYINTQNILKIQITKIEDGIIYYIPKISNTKKPAFVKEKKLPFHNIEYIYLIIQTTEYVIK